MISITTNEMRIAVLNYIENERNLAKAHKKLIEKRRHRSCAVHPKPKVNWKPRDCQQALQILGLMRDKNMRVTANCYNFNENTDFKIMLRKIADKLSNQDTNTSKSDRIKIVDEVKRLACRVVEMANEKTKLNNNFDGALYIHHLTDRPNWRLSVRARGPGIFCTSGSDDLLHAAINDVEQVVRNQMQ
jgi:hypothetical protein